MATRKNTRRPAPATATPTVGSGGRVTDLDAYLADILGPAPKVRLLGREWTLARELPTAVRLALIAAGEDEVLAEKATTDLLTAVLGKAQYDELVAMGVGPTGKNLLVIASLAHYNGKDPAAAIEAFLNPAPADGKPGGQGKA